MMLVLKSAGCISSGGLSVKRAFVEKASRSSVVAGGSSRPRLFFICCHPRLGCVCSSIVHDRRLLVLVDDLAVRSSHSTFFKSLQTRGFDLDFKLADDPRLSLQRYGRYLYDGLILFSPSIQRFGGSMDQNMVLDFMDAGHDLILAADSFASDLIQGIATESGIDFDEDFEAMVIDHTSYAVSEMEGDHTLIISDDLIHSDVSFGDKKKSRLLYSFVELVIQLILLIAWF